MWRLRLQAKAIRERELRKLRARPPEQVKQPEKPPEIERLPAEP